MRLKAMRKRTTYIGLAVILLLLILVIGILAYLLFTIEPPSFEETEIDKRPTASKFSVEKQPGGIQDTVIAIGDDEPSADPDESTATTDVAEATSPDFGLVPTVCDDYGPIIRNRDAYPNPTIFDARVRPDHVVFTLEVGTRPPPPKGGP